jgi:hypothetical protein
MYIIWLLASCFLLLAFIFGACQSPYSNHYERITQHPIASHNVHQASQLLIASRHRINQANSQQPAAPAKT